jgi:4-amino-4-deoxy-L-arabinose transferase-like glycosyltransferase
LTLQLFLYLLLRACFVFSSAFSRGIPFEVFIAGNIHRLFALSEVAVTTLHLLSLLALYRFARKLLVGRPAALLAVLAYATSFPALYYASRISPEPLLVTFYLLTFVCIWNYQEHIDAWRFLPAFTFVAMAGLCSTAAFFTKVHLAGLLIPFATLQILLQKQGTPNAKSSWALTHIPGTLLFLLSSCAGLLLGSLKVDWALFWRYYYAYAPGANPSASDYDSSVSSWANYVHAVPGMATSLAKRIPQFFGLYATCSTYEGLFAIAECVFLLSAVLGLVMLWKHQPRIRTRVSWLLLYWLIMLPVLIHRGNFHYYFAVMAIASVFCAHFLWEFIRRRTRDNTGGRRQFRWAVLSVVLIHAVAIVFYVNTRYHDVLSYRETWLPYYEALDQLNYGERIALLVPDHQIPPPLWHIHGIYPYSDYVPADTPLQRAFDDLFVVQVSDRRPDKEVMLRHRIGVILTLGPSRASVQRMDSR